MRILRALSAAALTAFVLWQPGSQRVGALSSGVVISQVYGGGGNTGATYKNDFIELFNRGNAAVTLTGYSVQYSGATGTTWTAANATNLPAITLQAGQYYLIQEAAGAGGTTNLPGPDTTGSIALAAAAGKVALVTSTTLLTGACPTGGTIVDFIGYGNGTGSNLANCSETSPAATLTNTTAAIRATAGCTETDNNSTDFSSGAPNPRNSGTIAACGAPTNPSGNGAASPSDVIEGSSTLLTVSVTPGANPASSGLAVAANLTSIGGSATQTFFDNATNGDATAGDNVFSFRVSIPVGYAGSKSLPATITDAQSRTGSATIGFTVRPVATLPFSQNWTNPALITTNNDWSNVPGMMGYRGDGLVGSPGADPRTIVADGGATPVNVIANQSTPNTNTTGGIAEFDGIGDPVVALQGSGTASAPFLLISLSTLGQASIQLTYNVRDVDGSADNAVQQVALQYRIGSVGNFTNIPAGYVADATDANTATRVTPINLFLPGGAENQPLVQLRIITADALGSDEWVGIDDITIQSSTASTSPAASGAASPNSGWAGDSVLLTATVTPGQNPVSTEITVTGDLTSIGGSATQSFFDDGTNGDVTAGDDIFSFQTASAPATTTGLKSIPIDVRDAQNRAGSTTISYTVQPASTITPIHDIQGPGSQSPLVGQTVTTSGIVTAVKSSGFYIQTPDSDVDADPHTSEGVQVFGSVPAGAVVGNRVRVTGTVQEFIPAADPGSPPLTELTSATLAVLATGAPLPAPQLVTFNDINTTTGPEPLERFEGMRVQITQVVAIAPTGGFINEPTATSSSNGVFHAVMPGVPRPFREPGLNAGNPVPNDNAPNPPPANVPQFDTNPERLRIETTTLGGAPLDVATGAVVTNLVGVLDFRFRAYTVLTEAANPPSASGGMTLTPVRVANANEFTVASFNMERFFDTTDDPSVDDVALTTTAFNNRLNKASLAIRNVLRTPDVIGVEEMENLSTLQAVASKVNNDASAASQPNVNYQAFLEEGNDIGGIDVGFLVNVARVEIVDVTQYGKTTTYIDPNTNQPALLNDRPPLLLRAIVHVPGHAPYPVTVIVNHLRSLNGVDDPVDKRVRTKRRSQAEYLADLIQARQAADPAEHIISVGDYNAFQVNDGFVDSIGTIKGTPTPPDQVTQASPDLVNPNLVDLVDMAPVDQRYSYTFDGNAQEIDHILITQNLLASISYARIDADFPEIYRNDPNRPERISDHDMVVGYFVPDSFPVCAAATPSAATLWPPDHRVVAVGVQGVTDADGDPLTIAITSIFQDELTNNEGIVATSVDGGYAGHCSPILGVSCAPGTAYLRAERGTPKPPPSNGRAYHVFFTATDPIGASCSGEVTVTAPLVLAMPAQDDGALYDSTIARIH